MIYPFYDENGIEHNPSMIEVLGYAINNIIEIEEVCGESSCDSP